MKSVCEAILGEADDIKLTIYSKFIFIMQCKYIKLKPPRRMYLYYICILNNYLLILLLNKRCNLDGSNTIVVHPFRGTWAVGGKTVKN